ncbi:hypothetical protein ACROYT_G015047 [Oculina patagonica]
MMPQNVQSSLSQNGWLIISHDITDALSHIHTKGFLHCDLKSNNVLHVAKYPCLWCLILSNEMQLPKNEGAEV